MKLQCDPGEYHPHTRAALPAGLPAARVRAGGVPAAAPVHGGPVRHLYGPLFGLILLTGLGGVLGIRIRRRPVRLARLAGTRRAGSALPWATAVVLLVFPIAVADFDYRYLLPVLPFACLAAGMAFAPPTSPAPRTVPAAPEPAMDQQDDDLASQVPGQAGGADFADSCRGNPCHARHNGANLCKGDAKCAELIVGGRDQGRAGCERNDEWGARPLCQCFS